eukprot:CAMPEP_0119013158 /NCGR_PEP_ID=MMETSP1176-20130426/8045_1 /TAXON_ID=265551 /ORGANISM="Synedropsis recta cf, Strain CCMP1620" /LENGTH=238 /DNA_ID=CAMNT_0006966217 /DNA_START=48 /DNA_END=764 /DNA_ORIENTATION=+
MAIKSLGPIAPPTAEDDFVEVIIPIEVMQETTMDRGTSTDMMEEGNADDEFAVMMGACVAGGCVGCLICGPWLACITGACSAYGTTRPTGAAGDCTRSMGTMALSCRAKAIEVNEKHHVVGKTKIAAVTCWQKLKDISERNRILERTRGCVSSSWEGMQTANSRYRITDRAFEGVGRACTYVNDKVIGDAAISSTNEPPAATTASLVEQPSVEGESRKPVHGDTTKGAYVALKTDTDS